MMNTEPRERGWLGNPYRLDDGYPREKSIALFTQDLLQRIDEDPAFRKELYELQGATLGCWCQRVHEDEPACHGEVLAKAIDAIERTVVEDNEE